jgi:hypothetical protein
MDSKRNRVFLFDGVKPENLTTGLYSFMKENSSVKLVNFLESIGIEFTQSASAKHGVGYSLGYDSNLNRVILYKKDFEFVDESKFKGEFDVDLAGYEYGDIVLYNNKFFEVTNLVPDISSETGGISFLGLYNGVLTTLYIGETSFDNTDVFVDKSFTLSYSFEIKAWAFEHDYKPDFMYSNVDLFTVQRNGTAIQKMNDGDYGDFGDTVKNFEIEITFNAEKATKKRFTTILINLRANDADGVLKIDNFDQVWLRNDYQSSDYITLVNKDNTRYTAGRWAINKFRDIVEDKTVPFIENDEPKASNHNANMVYYKKDRFQDKFLTAKFVYLNSNNYRLSLYDVEALYAKVLR